MRTVKPEFWVDDKVVDLDILPKLLFIGLWNFADDDGYIEDSARRIKRQIFPDNDYDVANALDALVASGMLRRAMSDQGPVLHIVHFRDHQKPQHPTPTKFTGIHESNTSLRAVSATPHEDSRKPHEGSSRRGEESSGEKSSAGSTAGRGARISSDFVITPSMREWAAKEVPLVDLDAKLAEFVDYWVGVPGAKGVKVDWESTWRNGMRKQQQFAQRDRPKGNTDWALRA
jgi:hypothetical protein